MVSLGSVLVWVISIPWVSICFVQWRNKSIYSTQILRRESTVNSIGCSWENTLLAKIFIESVPIFHERPGTKFHPWPWMWGYQTLCLQDGRCSTWKENTLNMHSKQDFIQITIFIIVVPILKVIRNLVQTFHLCVDSLIWFRYQMIVCAWPNNEWLSSTEWPSHDNPASDHIFLGQGIFPAAGV